MAEGTVAAPVADGKPTIGDKLSSRKFILSALGILGMIVLGYVGALPWKEAAENITWIVMFYVAGEGLADSGGSKRFQEIFKQVIDLLGKKPGAEEK